MATSTLVSAVTCLALGLATVGSATAATSTGASGLLAPPARLVAANGAISVIDDSGQRVSLEGLPRRIVSLAPSATEMLFAAGLGDRVVATVDYADEPPQAKRIPRIGDVTAVDIERLVALRADLVIAWPGGGNPAQVDRIERLGIPIYRQQVNRLRDLPASLRRLGELAADRTIAERAARDLEAQLAHLESQYGHGKHPTVLLQIWNHPVYTVGGTQLMSDALTLCGARNVFGDLRELGPAVDTEAVIARNPDIIVAVAPPGEAAGWLAEWRRFPTLRAVREGRLVPFEDQRFNRLGPSVIAATDGLCKALAAADRP